MLAREPKTGGGDPLKGVLAGARPAVDELERAVSRARAQSALFGDGAAMPRIGRYVVVERAGAGGIGVVWAAYDPELNRAVAIKLVPAASAHARERVLAEGQALACLSHPNVVPVFDVGVYGDQVFLVMELVRGETLRAHVAARPRDPRAIAQIYRQAGEGLAAAHRAGLVHRDFKPDNAIVGHDGRVRVLDFGLACPAAQEGESASDSSDQPGLGTPRYMAPEQAGGSAVTPAADQYAFCVSLREALTGPRPGDVRPAVPRWLEAIIARGTQPDPAARFASMDEVTRALARDPRVLLRSRLLVVAALALTAGAFAVGRAASQPESDPVASCNGGRAAMASVWGPGQRRALLDRLAGERDPFARDSGPRIAARLDDYRDRWTAGHRDACVAHRRGEQSAALLDRRMACLARGKAALAATADVVAAATGPGMTGALIAVGELPDLGRCSDPAAMLAAVPPPPPALAARAGAVDADIERALVLLRAGRSTEARELVVVAVAAARKLEHAPVLARALLVLGRVEMESPRRSRAIAPLGEATTLALAVSDDALAVEAFARRAWADGTGEQPDFARALEGLPFIEALAARLGPDAGFARALLHNNVAGVEQARGRQEQARAGLERALVESRMVTGAGAIELAKIPAHVALVERDVRRRDQLLDESTRRLTAELGADHPMTLDVRIMAGVLSADPRDAIARLTPACRAYARLHPGRGAPASRCWFEVGWLAHERGDDDAVEAAMTELVRTAPSGGEPHRVGLGRAYLALARGDPAAEAAFAELRRELGAMDGQPWWVKWIAAEAELGLALSARSRRDGEAALDRAGVLLESVAAAQPAVYIERRLARVRAELARRRAARGARDRDVSPLARAAADWYRGAGGYDAVVAELARIGGST